MATDFRSGSLSAAAAAGERPGQLDDAAERELGLRQHGASAVGYIQRTDSDSMFP